ncbi:YciI family protein [Thiolinea disciformis]|uniref:YciI family protein n=1 Tax=Thiolinea disciformis TaxID=125614 RepID=UPI00037FB16F|nr:YciI family protein [Thiolinea disciformis]
MLYVIIGEDAEHKHEARLAARPEHVARLNLLRDQGRLVIAGPMPAIESNDPGPAGFTGSVIIAEFDSLQAAKDWLAADPYQAAGVYKTVTIKPFKKVLP